MITLAAERAMWGGFRGSGSWVAKHSMGPICQAASCILICLCLDCTKKKRKEKESDHVSVFCRTDSSPHSYRGLPVLLIKQHQQGHFDLFVLSLIPPLTTPLIGSLLLRSIWLTVSVTACQRDFCSPCCFFFFFFSVTIKITQSNTKSRSERF